MAYNFSHLKNKTKEAEEWLKKEFASVRTDRASPAILDAVFVEVYGTKMALKELANIGVEDPKTIRIVPWDRGLMKDVEKAIVAANLGLSVSADDKGLRVIFPSLTEERRAELIKKAKEKLEQAKITLRGLRDEVWKDIQEKERAGGMGEDEKFRQKDEMQKHIDGAIKNLEGHFSRKEKEILGKNS